MPNPLVIAHRGDPTHALENSLDAIQRALDLSVDMIELDVRRSRDNGLYVMHDRMTGRTADKNIDMERSSSEKISRVTLKNNEPVPALSEVCSLVNGRCGLNLEIKSKGAGALTAVYIRSSGYHGDILISSFKEQEIRDARAVMPELSAGMIFDSFPVRSVPRYAKKGYTVISLSKKTVSEELVSACHEQGVKVYVWTVDDEENMRQLIAWGVDGLYSNRPGVLKKIVDAGRGELNAKG